MSGAPSRPVRVLMDTDPGIDDAAAILLALGSPEIDLVGLATVAGNAPLAATTRNALRVLELAGAVDVPVEAGAERALVHAMERRTHSVHGDDGLGGALPDEPTLRQDPRHAIDLLADACRDEPLTVVAIGPLTNLAIALARYPWLPERIDGLSVMGGARQEGNVTAAAEFNVWADPEAAARVLGSGIPVTLLPLDITHQAVLTATEIDELAASGRIGAALARMVTSYGRRHVGAYGEEFAPLHDVLAVQALVAPETITFADAEVRVDTGWSPSRGATLVRTIHGHGGTPARVGERLDRDAFARLLLDRVAGLGQRRPAGPV